MAFHTRTATSSPSSTILWSLRPSHRVKRMPESLSDVLSRFCTIVMIFPIMVSPWKGSASAVSGMMISSAATKAFTVRSPSDGGQSRRMKS